MCRIFYFSERNVTIWYFNQNISNRKFGFFSVGDGLTSGECVNLYSAVKQLQYDLNRNLFTELDTSGLCVLRDASNNACATRIDPSLNIFDSYIID